MTGVSNGIPFAYWSYDNRLIQVLAWSTNGDTSVDAAAIVTNGQISFVAQCNEVDWINVAVVEYEQQNTYLSNPANEPYIQELDDTASAIGAINPVTPDGPGCSGPFAFDGGTCTVQTVPPE